VTLTEAVMTEYLLDTSCSAHTLYLPFLSSRISLVAVNQSPNVASVGSDDARD